MSDQWFYVKGGQQVGPVSQEQLRALIANGTILPSDMVWTEGYTQWVPASSLPPAGQMSPISSQGVPAPGQPARPTSVTVIAIIGIIFGSLGILCTLGVLIALLGMGQLQTGNQPIAVPQGWLIFTSVIGIVLAIVLLVSSIAALSLVSWARKGLLTYAVVGVIMNVISAAVNAMNISGDAPPGYAAGYIAGSFIIGLILPGCILYFMTRPHVVAAFEQGRYRI